MTGGAALAVATLVALGSAVALVVHARRRLAGRPLLAVGLGLAALPSVLALLVWHRLAPETYVRLLRYEAAPMPLVAMALVAFRLASSDRARRSRVRAVVVDASIALAVLALGAAVVGVELGRPLDRLAVIVAVDRSRSIELVPSGEATIQRELRAAEVGMRPGDRIGTVAFGAKAMTEDPPREAGVPPTSQRASIPTDGTDLEAALRRAIAEIPADAAARIVIVSDGVSTRGDASAGAAAALAAQIPVDVLPLEQRPPAELRVVAVRAPSRGAKGESVDLRVVTSAPEATEVELRVRRDGELVRRGKVALAAGEDVVRLRETLPDAGLHRYDVEVTAPDPRLDTSAEDNSGSVFVRVRGPSSALVVEGDAGQAGFVVGALREAGFRVDEVGAGGVPADLGAFAAYDLVVWSDVAAATVAPEQIEALAAYVRDFGGGLLLLGGDRGFGPGGYAKTPIEEVAPVSFDLKQEHRRASLAEVIGIDISGSMAARVGGRTKLELANEAAARSAALLGPGDRLGVEHVDTKVYWSVPLGPVDDAARIDRAIRSVEVGGGGILVPITLREAYDALRRERSNLRHVLLFADGDDAEELEGAKPLASAAQRDGITTSVVALGSGKDVAGLEELSRLGAGRYYFLEDATRLPAVFAQETVLASRSALVEEPFRAAARAGGQVLAGVDVASAPPLGGYVVTIPKQRATVLLTGPEDDPVLALWSVGVGRAGAFTSDLKSRWGAAFAAWPGASRLVGQLGRDLARRDDDDRVRVEAEATGGRLQVRASVVGDDGRAQSFRRLAMRVSGPGGFTRDLPLDPAGVGVYAASMPLDRSGPYLVLVRDEATGDALGTTGAVLSAGEELRSTGSDVALLERIAAMTRGRRLTTLASVFADRSVRRFAYTDLTSWLVAAGAFLVLLAVGARRLALPEALRARLAAQTNRRARPRPDLRHPLDAGRTLEALRSAQRSARGPEAPPASPPPPPPAPARVMGAHPIARAASPAAKPASTDVPVPPPTPSPAGPSKPKSAAEILLERRRRS